MVSLYDPFINTIYGTFVASKFDHLHGIKALFTPGMKVKRINDVADFAISPGAINESSLIIKYTLHRIQRVAVNPLLMCLYDPV